MSKELEKKETPHQALMKAFKEDMGNLMPYLEKLLPHKGDAARFESMTYLAILRFPNLLTCDKPSLLRSLIWCAQKDLEPGVDDGCWLIPFKNKYSKLIVTPVPAYKGLIKKAVETESVRRVEPYAIYEMDTFEQTLGSDPHIVHIPPKLGVNRGKMIGAYVVITESNGDKRFHVMDLPQIEKIRNSSAAYKANKNEGPWAEWPEPMALKTVTKQGLKYVPVKAKLRDLLRDDNRLETGAAVSTLIKESGDVLPEGLELEEEPPGEKGKGETIAELDTSKFNDLLAAKMLHPDRLARVNERLKEIAGVWTENSKSISLPGGAVYRGNKLQSGGYETPYSADVVKVAAGEMFEQFWADYEEWEADKYPSPPEDKKAAFEPPGAGEAAAAETETGKTAAWGDFVARREAAFQKLVQKGVPALTSGILKAEDITEENINQVEELGNTYQPPRKGKK